MKIFLFTCVLFSCTFSFAQTNSSTNKLAQVFSVEELQTLKTSNPGLLKLYYSYADKGFEISSFDYRFKKPRRLDEVPMREKGKSVSIETFINQVKSPNFNPLIYGFIPNQNDQVFQLGDTNMYFLIPSQNYFLNN